ncbi:MAG: thiolase family protein [Thermoproteota archaeon]|nr:thiolase family protein [Thermoproteota archaeon]
MKVAIDSGDTLVFQKSSDQSLSELASRSIMNLLKKTRIEKHEIDGLIVSTCSNEQYLGNIISEMVNLKPKISTRIENLCNSGTSAIFLAYSLISSGLCNAIIVTGIEKQNSPGNKLLWDITRGIYDLPIHWASLFAKTHFRNFNTSEEDLALISEKNHKNANQNPHALFYKKKFNFVDIMNSKKIVEPLKMLDCCYPCEGASSLLLLSEKFAKRSEVPIWIKGISQNNQGASFANISFDLRSIASTKIASKEAFNQAEIKPSDIDIAEVHDAFTIMEILAYEDIGFTEKGKGSNFIKQEKIHFNTRGGLLGCGHPIGATGIDQTNEIILQLQEKAPKRRQRKNCSRGLIHNMAAAGTSTTIIILEK